MNSEALNQELQGMDLSLLDQLLKGRFSPESKILDAGFGSGRNSFWFLANGFDVFGVDQSTTAVTQIKEKLIQADQAAQNFVLGDLLNLPYSNDMFDLIICNAVLHFAKNVEHFEQLFAELMRVLSPEGILFIRMTSDMGISDRLANGNEGVYLLPDGSHRFLLTRKLLSDLISKYNLKFVEAVKTVNVNDVRCMTTLVLSTTMR